MASSSPLHQKLYVIGFLVSLAAVLPVSIDGFILSTPSAATPGFSSSSSLSSKNDPSNVGGFQDDGKMESVRSMVDDDEWSGVTMELTDAVSKTVLETLQKQTKGFIGKDDYKWGDISREIDNRMKKAVANLRGKENYEVGDLVAYVTEKSITVAEEKTGMKLEKYTELSKSIDKKVKTTVASYVGEEDYKSGALAKAVAVKAKSRLVEFADHYELKDVASELLAKRKVWAAKYLGQEFVESFTWTDLANKFTGKDDYHVGDVSKKVIQEAKKMLGKTKSKVEDYMKTPSSITDTDTTSSSSIASEAKPNQTSP